jgi:hypothetical protein
VKQSAGGFKPPGPSFPQKLPHLSVLVLQLFGLVDELGIPLAINPLLFLEHMLDVLEFILKLADPLIGVKLADHAPQHF